VENAMHHHFHPGPCRFYNASALEILEPSALKGKMLTIYHEKHTPLNNYWRNAGAKLEFKIKRTLLEKSDALFTGAAQELRRLPDVSQE
jgi:hypothetical protein